MKKTVKINRRQFIKITALAGGGLVIGVSLYKFKKHAPPSRLDVNASDGQLGAWLKIGADEKVTVAISKSEMGQGITTALSMIIADELGAAWSSIQTQWAPLDPVYGRPQTGASRSVRDLWEPLRNAGAIARTLLIKAAAQQWDVKAAQCYAENNDVINKETGARVSFGRLANSANRLPIPRKVILKDTGSFRLIGKDVRSLEAEDMVTGKTRYGYDINLPGMLTAVVERCPVFGGTVERYDEQKALSIKGVKYVVPVITPTYEKSGRDFIEDFIGKDFLIQTIGRKKYKKVYKFVKRKYYKTVNLFKAPTATAVAPAATGVAVVAEDYWHAEKGRRALTVTWNEGKNAELSSEGIEKLFKRMEASHDGEAFVEKGDIDQGMSQAAKVVESIYIVPFLAHATMEPMNCTADVRSDSCEIWVPTQIPINALKIAKKYSKISQRKIKVNKTIMGGGFGRRQRNDFVAEAVQVSKAVGAPVKVLWTREDDMKHDFYRPATYNKLTAGLDHNGIPVWWRHRVVGKGTDTQLVEGIDDTPYHIDHKKIELIRKRRLIPSGALRGVADSQNTFVTESFMDELAFEGRTDPLEIRLALLENEPRYVNLLEKTAEMAKWGHPSKEGRYQGISLCTHNGTAMALVVEISIDRYHTISAHRVWATVDCGRVVNPLNAEHQIEGAIIYGLSQALNNQITIQNGRVEQSNFHDYQAIRMDEAPEVKTVFIKSENHPTGIGEIGALPIVPAVTNAYFAATGRRIYRLPIS